MDASNGLRRALAAAAIPGGETETMRAVPRAGRRPGLLARLLRAAPAALLAAALGACSNGDETARDFEPVDFPTPETRLDYEVVLEGAPSDAIAEDLRASLSLWRRREDGAPSLAILRRRAEQDVESARTVMNSHGYYEAAFRTEVAEAPPEPAAPRGEAASPLTPGGPQPGERPSRPAAAPAAPEDPDAEAEPELEPRARARFVVEPGRPFTLERHRIRLVNAPEGPPLVLPAPEDEGSPVGARADAGAILEAENRIVSHLRAHGRPWAERRGRRAVIDPEAATMRVTSRIAPGPYAEYDGLEVRGNEQVNADHIRSYRPWRQGEAVDRRQLRDYQSELMTTQLFNTVSVDVPENPPPPGRGPAAPVIVRVEEAPARSVAAGIRYNTDLGPETRLSFVHRNLFNSGERLETVLETGFERQRLRLDFRKPQFGVRGQDLTAAMEIGSEETDAYDAQEGTLAVGLEREIEEVWTVGLGLSASYARISDAGLDQDVALAGVPGFVRYDGTDDLLNPTEGYRLRLTAAPYSGQVDEELTQFLHLELGGSAYLPLNDAGDLVLAVRGRAGSILSEDLADVPATHRLYSGGGGSVRGYQERFIGPLDANNDPEGGRAVLEAGTELRAPISGPIGGAAFVEAGAVSNSMNPEFGAGVQIAAGLGLRYYSPVGPIRFDVGVPLNPRDVDDPFGLYFSIGQAY
jgi:translocation and assembly module TamA